VSPRLRESPHKNFLTSQNDTEKSESLATRYPHPLPATRYPLPLRSTTSHPLRLTAFLTIVHGIDFLLTWNCKHINNRYTTRKIEECCQKMGFTCPVIATPTELMEIEL